MQIIQFSEINLLTGKNQTYPKDYWEKRTLSPSALVACIGVNGKVDGLKHHNLFLNKDWEEGFKNVFESENIAWPQEPSST